MPATYTGDFELRKLLIKLARSPAGGTTEDIVMVTWHFAKLTAGAPDANWLTADYTAVEARVDTWWAALKANYPASTQLIELRWFKAGPAWEPIGSTPSNPATRITARAVVGTGSTATGVMPPQCAVTTTKMTEFRKRWGRVYMPAPIIGASNATATAEGRVSNAMVSAFQVAHLAFVNGCRADGKRPVVWSRAKAAYTTPGGVAIAAHSGTAYEVTILQTDNLFDIQRRRRYDAPTLRNTTSVT